MLSHQEEMSAASRTAWMVAAYRARATAREPPVCHDPWAEQLAGEEGFELARRYDGTFPHMELWIALRTAFLDEQLRRFTSPPHAFGQVVLLGAGLDTRAARLAREGVRFFEVDHADSQQEKRARLARVPGYPVGAATYVTCDFEHEDFLDRLVASGFATADPALFLWEGVTAYLTEQAVRATLRRVASGGHPRSVLAFDHLRRKIVAGQVSSKDLESRSFVADLGEPLRFGIDYPLPMLYEEGFRRVRMFTFDEIALELTGTYDRDRAFRFQGLVLATRASPGLT
jgi:methyltransferase (TIGR00027 family)